MATSRPSHLRDKPATSNIVTSPNGRRPPGSPDRRLATEHKPTAATSRTVKPKSATTTTATAKRAQPVVKKPVVDKPPSPSRAPQRTHSNPVTTREKSGRPGQSPSTSSPVPRTTSLLSKGRATGPQPAGPKKAVRGAKAPAFTRSKSMEVRKKKAVPVAGVTAEGHNTSASDSEAVVSKKGVDVDAADESVRTDDSPKTEGEPQSPDVVSEHEHLEAFIAESIEEGEDEEVNEEKVETPTMLVNEIPKEPVAEAPAPAAAAAAVAGPKKEAQRNNDVIEEAKSKFLQKRKNAVLALVGAFETVITMQEPSKSMTTPEPSKSSPNQQKKSKEPEEEAGTPTEEHDEEAKKTEADQETSNIQESKEFTESIEPEGMAEEPNEPTYSKEEPKESIETRKMAEEPKESTEKIIEEPTESVNTEELKKTVEMIDSIESKVVG